LNITVSIDETSLATVIDQVTVIDEDGDEYEIGGRTLGDAVAGIIAAHLLKETEYIRGIRETISAIREDEIRQAIRPRVEEALALPIPQTNTYGEPTGKSLTLLELIVKQVGAVLGEKADKYRSESPTVLQKTIRVEVERALKDEVTAAVTTVRAALAGQIGDQLRNFAVEAVNAALTPAPKGR